MIERKQDGKHQDVDGDSTRTIKSPSSVAMRFTNTMNQAVYYIMATLLAGMCLLASLQIIVRMFLSISGHNLSVPWSEELSRSMMVWLIFLGAAYACRVGQMIALTFVIDTVPENFQRLVDGISALLCIGFYLLLIQLGMKAVTFGWLEQSPVLHFPKAYIYLAMPTGATIMIINTVALLTERGMFRRRYVRIDETPDVALKEGTFQ